MKTEPTDAEINEGIAEFEGYTVIRLPFRPNVISIQGKTRFTREAARYWRKTYPYSAAAKVVKNYTDSFDALREAMGKMTQDQQKDLRNKLVEMYEEIEWLLFHCPVRTLAEAVYQVVKGENK